MNKFTDDQIHYYRNCGANYCPKCESDNIFAGQADFDDVSAFRNVICLECKTEWTEIFEIITIEPLEE